MEWVAWSTQVVWRTMCIENKPDQFDRMAVNQPFYVARKLGDYLGCSRHVIESALLEQGTRSVGRRLGEVLLADEQISQRDLLISIKAQRLDRLRQCSLFSNLGGEELTAVAGGIEEVSIANGEQIIHQDCFEPYLFVLAAGVLEVFRISANGQETRLGVVVSGQVAGEIGYFSNGQRSVSVRALGPCELLRLHYDRLTECFEAFPEFAYTFMKVVSERLKRNNALYQRNEHRRESAERSLKHFNEFLDLSNSDQLEAGIEGLIERLVRTASNLTDADRASLFLIDGSSGDLWSKMAQGSEVKEIRVPAGVGMIGWVAEN